MRQLDPEVRDALERSFLATLPDDMVEQLLHRSSVREIPAGRVFISDSEPHTCGILISGLARVYAIRPNGAQVTRRRVGAGAAIGVRALVARRNQVNAQAITDCTFLRLSAEVLVAVGRRRHELAWAIAEELDRRLDDTHLDMESQIGGSVRQRVAAALLDLSVVGQPLEVPMTQERLAEIIAASREAVGRELRILKNAGLIGLKRGSIVIDDAIALEAVARDGSAGRVLRRVSR